jgi:alpha-tubulin suppressor-like RCC1 family protein
MAVAALAAVGCSDPTTQPSSQRPSYQISDGAHSGGSAHFYFLPPMVAQPAYTGTFDATLSPVVRITWGTTLVTSLNAVVDPLAQLYQANWHTGNYALDPSRTYRVTVRVGTRELGFADLKVVGRGSELRNVNTGEYVGLQNGRTLPIKLRIEQGWNAYGAVYPPEAGGVHTCRLTRAGAAWCWGYGYSGQLGDGTFYTSEPYGSATLVAVTGGHTFVALTAGTYHTCGITTAGAAWCWGANVYGQLGDGTIPTAPPFGSAAPVAVTGGLTFVALKAGEWHTCGITTAGAAYCWGVNGAGQLGNGTIDQTPPWLPNGTPTPVAVVGGLTFSSLGAGTNHTCGVTTAGAAWCWGSNVYGQLGDGTTMEWTWPYGTGTPVAVTGGHTFTAVSAGDYHSCGVTSANEAYCWGSSVYGELGIGSYLYATGTPLLVAPTAGLAFSAIGVGVLYSCGLTTAGAGYCWGEGNGGQRGDGTTTFTVPSPVAVTGGLTFTTLSVGFYHSCGLAADGTAYCWGSGGYGELGNGTIYTSAPWGSPTPVAVLSPPGGW